MMRLHVRRIWTTLFLLGGTVTALAQGGAAKGVRGEYGFISSASLGPELQTEIRDRVAVMAREYGIREFLFYDWFADYSTPVRGRQWKDPYFRSHDISLQTLRAALDEIHRRGGRAWAYVQAVGAEETDLENPAADLWKLRTDRDEWYWHPPQENPRFPTYFANAAWGRFMVQRWAPAIRTLGFDGIHWDTLGPIAGNRDAERNGLHAFLRTTRDLLARYGLRQTMNFVELHWWEADLIRDTCEFPYAEIWFTGTEQRYYEYIKDPRLGGAHGVMAMYPRADKPADWSDSAILMARHAAARNNNLVYVAVGDGARRVKHEYWSDTEPLNEAEQSYFRRFGARAPK